VYVDIEDIEDIEGEKQEGDTAKLYVDRSGLFSLVGKGVSGSQFGEKITSGTLMMPSAMMSSKSQPDILIWIGERIPRDSNPRGRDFFGDAALSHRKTPFFFSSSTQLDDFDFFDFGFAVDANFLFLKAELAPSLLHRRSWTSLRWLLLNRLRTLTSWLSISTPKYFCNRLDLDSSVNGVGAFFRETNAAELHGFCSDRAGSLLRLSVMESGVIESLRVMAAVICE